MIKSLKIRLRDAWVRATQEALRRHDAERDLHAAAERNAFLDTAAYVADAMSAAAPLATREAVLDAAVALVSLEGLWCEFGVGDGTSLRYLAGLHGGRLHGFDSFLGLPEKWRTGYPPGMFAQVALPAVPDNVELHIGVFEDTLPVFALGNAEPLAFLHVDCDLYRSTVSIFKYLSSHVRVGTVIVFDEYFNYPGWRQHEFRAFHEFVAARGFTYTYAAYNRFHEQVAVVIASDAAGLAAVPAGHAPGQKVI